VDGEVVRDASAAERHLAPTARAAAADDLVEVLARLHEVDVDAVGLGDLARREGYLERQLRRWHGQLERARTRPLPLLDDVHRRLAADLPQQGPATIVHGDYRLDNLMLDPTTGRVRAVLDWELTTLGDPLADVGLLLVYWSGPGDDGAALPDAPTRVEGFPDRAGVADRYAKASGRDLSEIVYYVAFGRWKLACILEGVHSRYVSGAYGADPDPAFEGIGELVEQLAVQADEAAREAGR
jgi:aminoglycoside phosphotransferase (APT) family kinase protein